MEALFLGLTGAAWFVIFVVVLVFVLQLCTKLPSDFVFLGGMMLLLVSGVIPAGKVLSGFSSSTVRGIIRGNLRIGTYRLSAMGSPTLPRLAQELPLGHCTVDGTGGST